MIYGNYKISEIWYGNKKITSAYLGNTKVFQPRASFKVASPYDGYGIVAFYINGELKVITADENNELIWRTVDTNVDDISWYWYAAGAYYLKNGCVYQSSDGSRREDLGTGWTALYNDKMEMYSSSDSSEGHTYTLGIRNGRVIGSWDSDFSENVSDWYDIAQNRGGYTLQFTKAKKVLTDYVNKTYTNGVDAIDKAYLLTTDGELWLCYGKDYLKNTSKLDFSEKVTDIRRENGEIYCISGGKKYHCTTKYSKGYQFVKDMNSNTFPTIEWGSYSIVDGVIYNEDTPMSGPENFFALSGGSRDSDVVYACTTDGKVYRTYNSELRQCYPVWEV